MKILIQTIIILLITNISFTQTNYYVNNSVGSDIPGNGSSSGTSAWKTIEYAVDNVANPTTDQIIINLSDDVYDLSNDQIDINRNFSNLTLIGQGIDNTFIQSSSDASLSSSRVIMVYSGNNVVVKMLTVRYGRVVVPEVSGGGILNSGGNLIIDYCKVTENFGGSSGYGGGISNLGGNLTINHSTVNYNTSNDSCYGAGVGTRNGSLNIYNSTISFNSALSGGGIAVISNNADANFNMENSTIYGNTSSFRFGAIRISIFGSNSFNITTNINSCTIFNNSAFDSYGGIGILSTTNFNIKNSIVAGNISNGNPDDLRGTNVIPIAIASGGFNIFQSVNNLIINGDQNNGIGVNPLLLPLADNNSNFGTQTCAILENSPAKDQIPALSSNGAPLLDQRGFQRDGDYDIGAYEYSNLSDVSGEEQSPDNFSLAQNYPNPFNPNTVIKYNLPKAGNVKLFVYNLLGQEVALLINEYQEAGSHNANFEAKNLNSGIYFYKMETNSFTRTKKMTLMK